MTTAFNLVAAGLVLAIVLSRQLRTRPVREGSSYKVMLVLGVIGCRQLGSYEHAASVSVIAWVLLAVSLVAGAAFGAARGAQVHVWRQGDGTLLRRGNAVTVALWVAAIAVHLGLDLLIAQTGDAAEGLGQAGLLAYLAVALATQQAVTLWRASQLTQPVRTPEPAAV